MDMKEAHCPLHFWDYCLERQVRIYNVTSRDHLKIHGSNPHLKPLENKATFPTSVSSNGMIGVILEITRPLSVTTKKYSVASSGLLKGKEMNWHNGSLSPMAMLCLIEQFGLCNSLNFIVIRKNGNEQFLMCSLRGDGDHQ